MTIFTTFGIILSLFLAWVLRKIYLRVTNNFLQIVFTTSSGKKLKTPPMKITEENLQSFIEFLNERKNNYMDIQVKDKRILYPRPFIENSTVEIRMVRRFSLESINE